MFRLASAAAIGLVAKSVAMARLWRMRTGERQNIGVDLGRALRRLSPFYEKRWELLNGYPPGMPSDPACPFMPRHFYRTRDGRHVLALNIYPRLKTGALRFLGCTDDVDAIARAIGAWNAEPLEQVAAEQGLQLTVVRTIDEFLSLEQGRLLAQQPLIEIEKIGDSTPEPLPSSGEQPLDGIRALGLGHVIAGAALGRALALHGADVLNVWRPGDFEFDLMYCTANVGVRSATIDIDDPAELNRFTTLLRDADVFFANRRPGRLARYGLEAEQAAELRPGIVHASISLYGRHGPWRDRIGFDQAAGAATGILALEGEPGAPRLPEIFVVNDYLVAWLTELGVAAALARRALEGGSYRVHVSLARVAMWIHSLGTFDKPYAQATAGSTSDHAYREPELFSAQTPCGLYQGVTEQVRMSRTPGHYRTVLVPRGSCPPAWLDRNPGSAQGSDPNGGPTRCA
ncbi:CoA transferase [Lysobacter sp. TAB13]|uniref:CoA transferase n=1 Tax=Lysobacter sp. TAB13 TaxID=3233065 RepID=UPI003F9E0809